MFKNSEVKKLVLIQILITIFIVALSIISSINIYKGFQQEEIKNNSYIVGTFIDKHPELESDIISSIILKENYDKGYEILKKYGLTNVKLLNYNKELRNNYTKTNIAILLLGIVSICIVDIIFIKYIFKKIYKIDKYMNNILNGDYSINIKDYCEGDISNLKNDTYKMTIKLKEQSELLVKEKKYLEEILEDISHQIKTPLTSMYMINEILSNEKDDNIRNEFLLKNENQIKRIEWLITTLLKMSRLDSGTIKLKENNINVNELINNSIDPIRELLELKNIKLILNLDNNVVNVDKNWVSEALLNIIKNACEHTKDKITIETNDNPLFTEIRISDNGNGINKNDLPHIFERFYKGSHNKDSIGIGLNMSMKIINLQNGTIEVDTKDSIGTTFTIKLFKSII